MTDLIHVRYEKQGHVLILTLNRPEKSNAINRQLLSDLNHACDMAEADEEVRVAVLAAEGRHFSVGADINEITGFATVADYEDFFLRVHDTFNRIENLKKPVIAAVNGLALGGGCEMCLVADLRFAADDASFGVPEIKLGALPGAGGTQRLPRLVGMSKAMEMIYTGDSVNANEAYRIGLVNRVVSSGRLKDEVMAFAQQLGKRAPIALRTGKLLVRQGLGMGMQAGLDLEIRSVSSLAGTEDQREGFRAFAEKREPRFTGR